MEDDLKTAQVASILRGEMIHRLMEALQEQPEKFDYREMVKLGGSAVPYLLAKPGSVKVPNDIDLAIHTTDGLRPRKDPEEPVKMLIAGSARECGYDFKPIATTSGEEHCAIITHRFTPAEIARAVTASGMEDLLAAGGIGAETLGKEIKVELPVHYVHNPLHLLDVLPYEKALPKKEGRLKPFMRDNVQDIFSAKLARVILGDEDKTPGRQASDMLDLARILDDPALRKEALADPDLLRVLVVTRISERVEPENRETMRFSFPAESADIEAFADTVRKKGYLVPPKPEIARTLHIIDDAIGEIFPERAKKTIPLTEGELQFIDTALKPDKTKGAGESINMDLLVQGKAVNVFERHPKMRDRIHYSSPLHDALNNHGACIQFH